MPSRFILKLLADVLSWTHTSVVVTLNIGLVLAIWIHWLRPIIFAGFLIIVILQWTNKGACWSTTIEDYLRKQYDPDYAPQESFVANMFKRWLGIKMTNRHVVILTYTLTVLSLILVLI